MKNPKTTAQNVIEKINTYMSEYLHTSLAVTKI